MCTINNSTLVNSSASCGCSNIFPVIYTLSGTVYNANGCPSSGASVVCTVNGTLQSVTAGVDGTYNILVQSLATCSCRRPVTATIMGISNADEACVPVAYTFDCVKDDISDLDFVLRPTCTTV